jgi:hypothetical protein
MYIDRLVGVITAKGLECCVHKKRSSFWDNLSISIFLIGVILGLAACTIATETSAHIATTSGGCARSKCCCNGEGKGEDHDNLSHCKRYLNVKTRLPGLRNWDQVIQRKGSG